MPTALSCLLAARRCEIAELERLSAISDLVGCIGQLVHALQRERGMSNIFLASGGERFAQERIEQLRSCEGLQAHVLGEFEAMAGEPGTLRGGARLFTRVAIAVDALEGLPKLRARVAGREVAPADATAEFGRIVGALLAVVFEAVDSAGDPEISRALVAMVHFMQGKEYAGQERALGAAAFAGGLIDDEARQRWRHLVQQQHQCFEVFQEFADAGVIAQERAGTDPGNLVQLERLRRIAHSVGGLPADEFLVERWYECCTARLDAMRVVEEQLRLQLRALCNRKIGEARAELRDQQATLERLHQDADAAAANAPSLIGPRLERSVLDMVHEQARRLQEMHDELEHARTALAERKLIERAKGVLMARRDQGEDEAYRTLRQMAMNQKRRLVDVAQAVLAMADVLPPRSR